jgi:restriction system protein
MLMADQVWMVRAGRNAMYLQDFIELKMVAIGWNRLGDLSNIHGRAAISQLVAQAYPEDTMPQRVVSSGQVYRFRDELTQDKNVITYDQNSRRYHLGVVAGAKRTLQTYSRSSMEAHHQSG